MKTKPILFICKGNSGRSQMAEAFFKNLSKDNKAISAGTDPDREIHPWTIKVMKEVGIDLTGQIPKSLTSDFMEKAEKIILMDSDLFANVPSKYLSRVEDWKIEKLFGKPIEQVREIRDRIQKKVVQLIKEP